MIRQAVCMGVVIGVMNWCSAQAAEAHSTRYDRLLADDAYYIFTSPARWQKEEWRRFAYMGAGVLGTMGLLDKPVRDTARSNHNGAMDKVARYFEPLGTGYALGVIGGFYAAGMALGDTEARAVAMDGFSASLIASGVITPAVKVISGRRRPSQTGDIADFEPFSGSQSFPSGHTTEAFALASVIAGHYEARWVHACAYGAAGLVGYARIYHDAHYASDVLAGALIGATVGSSIVSFNGQRKQQQSSHVFMIPYSGNGGHGVALGLEF